MRKLLAKARTRIGWAVIGSAATLALGGVATAAVIDSPATDEVSDVSTVTTPAAETTAPEVTEPTTAATTGAPAVITGVEVPAGTVAGVTEPAPVDSPAPASASVTPAPDVPVAEQSFGGQPPSPAEIPKLPGEEGYVAPDGSVAPPD